MLELIFDRVIRFFGATPTCEIERNGKPCGRPAQYHTMWAYNLKLKRFAWACEPCAEELSRYVRNLEPESLSGYVDSLPK